MTAIVENLDEAGPVTSTGSVRVMQYMDSRVDVETETEARNAFFVTSEAYYPGVASMGRPGASSRLC